VKNGEIKFKGMKGPLRVCKKNHRYFTDDTGKAIYLTGSHTWANLVDRGEPDPPRVFPNLAYLDMLSDNRHNFIRLWAQEMIKWGETKNYCHVNLFPWLRKGPGLDLDGKPKFNLEQFDQAYFDHLRSRIIEAGNRGMYASVMFFEGWALHASPKPLCWEGHPFHKDNNINNIDGDPKKTGRGLLIHTLEIPAITAIQKAYIRKGIETVNDLDNIIYEIANESGGYSTKWQYEMINFIHKCESKMPKQHPVGMTFQFQQYNAGTNENLFKSPADWISPNPYAPNGNYLDDPPAADGSKVILADTDHLWGEGGDDIWVWKSFCRGLHPIFMDNCADILAKKGKPEIPKAFMRTARLAMGQTRDYAERIDLVNMVPRNDLASSQYCLANPGKEYIVFLPDGGSVEVDLSAAAKSFSVEWLSPVTGITMKKGKLKGGNRKEMTAPFKGEAVLYLSAR
jgi:hypothetical protein